MVINIRAAVRCRQVIFSLLAAAISIILVSPPVPADEIELTFESAELVRVLPRSGNNPFNVNNPMATGRNAVKGVDVLPPVITPPQALVRQVAGATGLLRTDPAIQVFLLGARAIDNVDGAITNITNNAPATFPFGVTVVIFTARDRAGNTGRATSRVTVNPTPVNPVPVDTMPPVVTPPAPLQKMVARTLIGGGAAPVPATDPGIQSFLRGARAVDNVDGVIPPARITNNAPVQFPVGATVVTFSAVDNAGNIGTATSRVTVVGDTIPPVVTPPAPILVVGPPVITAVLPVPKTHPAIQAFLNSVRARDNLDGVIPAAAITNNAPNLFPRFSTTIVTFTARDRSGNVGTATGRVTVQ